SGKSTLLLLLAGEGNYSDAEILGYEKSDQQEAVQGILVYEIAELEGMQKTDVTKIKLFFSKNVCNARPAYARSRVDRPRRGIFVATTNDDTYLRDTTGNRRFWPVKVGRIDLAAVDRDLDQLWAEAVVAEASGEPLVIPETLWPDVAKEQDARMEPDAWEEPLERRLAELQSKPDVKRPGKFALTVDNHCDPECRVSTSYLLSGVLNIDADRANTQHTRRLSNVMRTLGWSRYSSVMRIGGVPCRGFVKAVE